MLIDINKFVKIKGEASKFIDYLIDEHGKILTLKYRRKRLLTPIFNSDNYLTVKLRNNYNLEKRFPIHLLVAETFISCRPINTTVNHIDTNKLNNYYKNLEYISHIKNMEHVFDHGLLGGIQSKESINFIRENYTKISVIELAKMFNVSRSTIWKIVSYKGPYNRY